MTCRLLVGDVFDRMAELEDHSFDLIITSPPFLALRSYLPDGHPDKAKEIGSESTPAEYLDVLLALTAEWRRLLAPHGSIAIELGDTYAASPNQRGPDEDGNLDKSRWLDGERLLGAARPACEAGEGWPLPKSLVGIPTLYTWSLAYGRNLLTGAESPAGRWRIRNLKPWIRTNPPVGALGDKERPATSYITVACTSSSRWFDLDAVRTQLSGNTVERGEGSPRGHGKHVDSPTRTHGRAFDEQRSNPGGAPPLDWYHTIDAIIDNALNKKPVGQHVVAGGRRQSRGKTADRGGNWATRDDTTGPPATTRGVHIRRALETAGILTTLDALDISPRGYTGAHYAVWPPELVKRLIDEMCPRRVCTQCGEPSRRIVGEAEYVRGPNFTGHGRRKPHHAGTPDNESKMSFGKGMDGSYIRQAPSLGWSDCGCEHCTCDGHDHRGGAGRCAFCDCNLFDHWRPGRILDPFSGSGTTLAVASGMGRDSIGIDLDPRNADLALERVGMFLDIDWGDKEPAA